MRFVYFTCKIDNHEAKLFDALADKKKVSRTELLREMIRDYLNKNLKIETKQEQVQPEEPQETQTKQQPETQTTKEEQPSEAQTNQQDQPSKEIEIDLEYIKDDFRPRTLEEMIPEEI
jgi:cell division protein FtsN